MVGRRQDHMLGIMPLRMDGVSDLSVSSTDLLGCFSSLEPDYPHSLDPK